MSYLNRVDLIGRLGKAPEFFQTQQAQGVRLSLCTATRWKDNEGQQQERTEWHQICLYNGIAKAIAEQRLHLGKGDLVYVEGRLQTRKWEDNNGQVRYTTGVVANRCHILAGSSKRQSSATTDTTVTG